MALLIGVSAFVPLVPRVRLGGAADQGHRDERAVPAGV